MKKADFSTAYVLLRYRYVEEIKSQTKGTLLGPLWLLVEPLVLLTVYSIVFTYLFPERTVAAGTNYVSYLAIGLWPWLFVSQSITRCMNMFSEYSALFKRTNTNKFLFILARILALLTIQLSSYVIVISVLKVTGNDVQLSGLLMLIPYFVVLLLLSVGICLFLVPTVVFIKDMTTMVPTLLTAWFFLSPIIWSADNMPAGVMEWLAVNPMYGLLQGLRNALLGLGNEAIFPVQPILVSVVILLIGWYTYNRVARHTEDYS